MAYENDWQKAWSKQLKNNVVTLTTNLDVTDTNLVLDSLTEKDVLSEEKADAVRAEQNVSKLEQTVYFILTSERQEANSSCY